jgi:hypothetical protein
MAYFFISSIAKNVFLEELLQNIEAKSGTAKANSNKFLLKSRLDFRQSGNMIKIKEAERIFMIVLIAVKH